MTLQAALIGLGIILMSIIYLVSRFYDRRRVRGIAESIQDSAQAPLFEDDVQGFSPDHQYNELEYESTFGDSAEQETDSLRADPLAFNDVDSEQDSMDRNQRNLPPDLAKIGPIDSIDLELDQVSENGSGNFSDIVDTSEEDIPILELELEQNPERITDKNVLVEPTTVGEIVLTDDDETDRSALHPETTELQEVAFESAEAGDPAGEDDGHTNVSARQDDFYESEDVASELLVENKVNDLDSLIDSAPNWVLQSDTDELNESAAAKGDETQPPVEDEVIDWESIVSNTAKDNLEKTDCGEDSEWSDDSEINANILVEADEIEAEYGSKNAENQTADEYSDQHQTEMNLIDADEDDSRIEPVFDLFDYADDDKQQDFLQVESNNQEGEESIEPHPDVAQVSLEENLDSRKNTLVKNSALFVKEHNMELGKFNYPEIEGFEKISQIDYWVKISGERDVGRESVLAQYRESASKISHPTRIYGIRIPDQNWCDLEMESEETRFQDIIVTLQLVDETGPVSESDLNKFTMLISGLSEGTGRGFTFMASLESAAEQAQAISRFVKHFDSTFMINIRPLKSEYLEGGAILRCATQLGLDPGQNQFFLRNKTVRKNKVCLYSLANLSDTGKFDFDHIRELRTSGVLFFTKPAVNRSPGAVFSEMVDTAKAFAARIKGEAVSANSEDLSQDDIDEIRQSIESVARQMEELGIPPGSDEAMRLFK